MQEYLNIIIPFILGGGLTSILTIRYVRKNSKIETEQKGLELDQKVIDFWKKQYDELLTMYEEQKKEIANLKAQIDSLKFCYNTDCKQRVSR